MWLVLHVYHGSAHELTVHQHTLLAHMLFVEQENGQKKKKMYEKQKFLFWHPGSESVSKFQ